MAGDPIEARPVGLRSVLHHGSGRAPALWALPQLLLLERLHPKHLLGRKTQPFDCLSTASPGRFTAVAPPSLQVPSKDDRTGEGRDSDPLPEIIQDSAGGRLWSAEIVPSSIIFHRSTGRGKPVETFISPGGQLRGVPPRNSKSGHQLIRNTWYGMLSLSPG